MSGLTYVVGEEGLRIDELARRVYGTERGGNTEAILAANPGLAAGGFVLPLGRNVALPERASAALRPVTTVNPWD